MLLPYDLILLTMVHEAMAAALGIDVGSYHHFCGSLHYYRDEETVVEQAIDEEIADVAEMPVMPLFDDVTQGLLAASEKQIRRALLAGEPPVFAQGLDPYWVHLLRAMAQGWLRRRGSGLSASLVAEIPEAYRAVLTRWSQ
jgi:thymidylate synthase